METITDLIKNQPIPKMVRIRQNFDRTCIPVEEIASTVQKELDRKDLGGKIKPGMKIAITCGSRGMTNNALMARAMVDFVKSKGAEPYIVAAMGSHGGATLCFLLCVILLSLGPLLQHQQPFSML